MTHQEHVDLVRQYMTSIAIDLLQRAMVHDASKLLPPEKEAFENAGPPSAFGTVEYELEKEKLGDALQHHYEVNDHHVVHYEDGINGMTIGAFIEFFCDSNAASKRHPNDSFDKSIEIHREKYAIPDMLYNIMKNTQKRFGW